MGSIRQVTVSLPTEQIEEVKQLLTTVNDSINKLKTLGVDIPIGNICMEQFTTNISEFTKIGWININEQES